MEDKHKRALMFFGALVFIAWILSRAFRERATVIAEPSTPAPANDFYAPYYWNNGIYPEARPFESTVNVYVDNPALAGLANQYIPMFGLVGMTAVQG